MRQAMVVAIKKQHMVALDREGGFVRLRLKNGLAEGQTIYYDKEDYVKTPRKSVPLLTAVAALLVVMGMTLWGPLPYSQAKPLMLVSMDINPSIEFRLDDEFCVYESSPLNQEAKNLWQEKWIGEPYEDVLTAYLEVVRANGYIQEEPMILFGYAWINEKDESLETMSYVKGINNEVMLALQDKAQRNIGIEHIEVDRSEFLSRSDESISVGKWGLLVRMDALEQTSGPIDYHPSTDISTLIKRYREEKEETLAPEKNTEIERMWKGQSDKMMQQQDRNDESSKSETMQLPDAAGNNNRHK